MNIELEIIDRTAEENDKKSKSKVKPYLNMRESGLISISKSLYECLELSPDDKIKFAIDKNRPQDWYIFKSNSDDAFERNKPINETDFKFTSKYTAGKFWQQFKPKDKNVKISISYDVVVQNPKGKAALTLYPLITAGIGGQNQ